MPEKWYRNWFNSPYYHILYNVHNDADARFFINNLCTFLQPDADAKILDVACGRGRHSVYLNSQGFDVTGIDLSEANIQYAGQFANEHLKFHIHDMREVLYLNYFDLALNLFTSFGYFDTERDHLNALTAVRKGLKPRGRLVIDYFNSEHIVRNLKPQEHKTIEGIHFNINKSVRQSKVIKHIEIDDHGTFSTYQEEVSLFSLADFRQLFELSGLELEAHFGDYSLNPFNADSERLILIAHKG